MSLFCGVCHVGLSGGSHCSACGSREIYCGYCRNWLPLGASACSCGAAVLVPSRPAALAGRPSDFALAVPVAPVVPERYSGGSHGIVAEVTAPAGDVAALNALGALVPVLHQVAAGLGQMSVHSDHTRKLMRDMRVLAADALEEIEMRLGTVGR